MEDHLPDEDALVLPDTWRRALHTRRGGLPGPDVRVDAKAPRKADAVTGRPGGAVRTMLEGRSGDPGLAAAAGRHLGGEPDPVGAAAVAVAAGLEGAGGVPQAVLVDALIVEHGLPFAACALVELASMKATRTGPGPWVGTWTGVERRGTDDVSGAAPETLRRVRALLASADDETYAEAVERLAAHRSGRANGRLVSYLVPTRDDWVDECCAAGSGAPNARRSQSQLLMMALGKRAQLTAASRLFWGDASRELLATLIDGIGAGAAGYLAGQADDAYLESAERKRVFEAIALLPSDEAFQALLDRAGRKHARAALNEAARRFPVRAMRLLARAGADDLLRAHVGAHAELAAAVLPDLPQDAAGAVERALASTARVPVAAPDEVPGLLADPPWSRPRRPVVDGLQAPEPRMAWRDGEREAWLGTDPGIVRPDVSDWAAYVEDLKAGKRGVHQVQVVVHGPEELVRPLLAGLNGRSRLHSREWGRVAVARYELDMVPLALRMAKSDTGLWGDHLLPVLDERVAEQAAGWLAKGGDHDRPGRAWFARHGLGAVALLVPAALGTKAGRYRPAEVALRHLAAEHGRDGVVDAARDAHGGEAADAVEALLSASPVETGLEQPAKTGEWADPAALPQVLLRGGGRALPADAVRHLIELLTLPAPYGMDELRAACEPGSVAEFGWALFEKWREAGNPPRDRWAMTQLGRTGDDATVRLLTPVIRAWPGEGGHKNAVNGLGVLAEIGSDVALMHLHGIAQKVKFKGLKAEAEARIREVADRLGLTTEQLADRLVPTFGLDAAGTMVLDYGPRRFVVGLDEHLAPFVSDEDGKRRKALPKPGAKDDPELAPAAHQRFAALKKDLRAAASGQLVRLEQAMVTRREWTPAEFGDFIVRHPLVRHIARRLVWIAQDGGTAAAFRVAEDGTFADAGDDAFALPERARVRIAHPLHLDGALEAWSEVFADYEIIQPFPQLNRPVRTLDEQQRGGGRLERFEGLKVPFGKVLGLVKRGWARGEPQDAGGERWISRRVADGRYVVIDLDPGISVGAVDATGDHQTLDYVWFATEPTDYRPRKGTPLKFGDLDPVMASEILADLDTLAEAAV
ncbi:DUF4132 domain-containing protein [Actinomadura verrucosospora]|uniref:WGR domain-containing protein n=1 Tax=Actinomadura verrucosospora TaxID=46165 RepID=A0A7D4AMG9_ACTVE|nr:DUF4132 domain-containing protein [Actinomadura verrucosospora]QKG20389.1 WGR domain-containing protein [Actinomadura verrucosospora]